MKLVNKNIYKSINYKCINLKTDIYKKKEHINTGNLKVLDFILYTRLYKKETIEIINKEVKFIQKLNLNKKDIFKKYAEVISKYTKKLKKYLKSNNYINKQENLVKVDLYNNIANTDITINKKLKYLKVIIKQNIKYIHQSYVITCANKIPNNFCIICKKYWMKTLYETTINKK